MKQKLYRSSKKESSKKTSWYKRFFNSNAFTIFLIIFFLFSLIKVTKELFIRYDINNEINELTEKKESLESSIKEINNHISFLQTDYYIEKEARLKLNLAKPGEKQINLLNSEDEEIIHQDEISNISKWFNYFFK
jgi:cell division protein FtsB